MRTAFHSRYATRQRATRLLRATVVMLTFAAACGAADGALDGPLGGNPDGTPSHEKGAATGRVTDSHGRPIVGAQVVVNNTVWFNRNVVVVTDANGYYRAPLPASDSWYVRGTTTVSYNGKPYTLELHPDYAGSFTGSEGHVVNLQWRVTGEVPKLFGHDGYYGGTIEIDPGWDLADLHGVTFTLTPVGALIDGSTAPPITRTLEGSVTRHTLYDVPIGRYHLKVTRNGQPAFLRMRHTTTWVNEITADFEPAYPGATAYGLYFSVASSPM